MTLHYIDSSALLKVIRREEHSSAMSAFMASHNDLVSSDLLETEVLRTSRRLGLPLIFAERALARVTLLEIPRASFRQAGILQGDFLRSLDALHIATALRVGADTVVSYDDRFIEIATVVGIDALSPHESPQL